MTGAGEHWTLRHRSCSAPTALDGQQHRRSAGERHDRDRYRDHVRAGRRQRRLGFVVGLIPMIAGSRIVRRTHYHHLVNRSVSQRHRRNASIPRNNKSGPAAKRQDHFMHSTRPCVTQRARSAHHGVTPWRPPHPARRLPSPRRRWPASHGRSDRGTAQHRPHWRTARSAPG